MENNSNTTSHHICGFWFHVTWGSDNVGRDQHGSVWTDKSNPQPRNEHAVNACLINYVNIKRYTSKNI